MGVSGRSEFLGIEFDLLDEQAVARALRDRTAAMPFRYLVTPNVDHVVRLSRRHRGDGLRRAYAGAGWRLCDSRVLARLAALRGVALPVVPGSDLTARLMRDIVVPGDRLCLIGGVEGDVAALARLRPDVTIIQHVPPMGLADDMDACAAAARFAAGQRARFTLLAVGSPAQELIAASMALLPEARGTALCIGASVAFLTGRAARAPRWMQLLALEWLHRLLADPARLWRRYLVDGPRVFLLAWRWKRPDRTG